MDTAYLLSDVFKQVDTESFKAMIPSRGGFVCRNLGLIDCCSYWATCYQGNNLKFPDYLEAKHSQAKRSKQIIQQKMIKINQYLPPHDKGLLNP